MITDSIQVQVSPRRGGGKREVASKEAFAFALAALGAVNRWAGVLWKNALDPNGNPLAVAVIPGARFREQNGRTILDSAADDTRGRP